ncbi:hypothetical protein Cgig2_032182 [Carnegiea gigantea]|uniref:Cysteine-rich receptor-like protein kinase 10 n=1 Tax=Carnegiea gigantea TaxID=171969 RepID=A0A9Q1GN70_9CARY|nr:hypothetical protein Cgig2_032182 [Carnegiea gigantea]
MQPRQRLGLDQSTDVNCIQTDTYKQNLNLVLSDLVNHASNSSFYNSTAGEAGIDRSYAFFYCRGDIGSEDCRDCVQAAALEASENCPSEIEVIVYYFQCTLRYANRSVAFSQDEELWSYAYSPVNVSNPDMFEQTVSTTMNTLISQAAYNSTLPGFARGVANYSSSNVYFLVQCTPEILGSSCEKCLVGALKNVRTGGPKAAYILYPNCQFMYDFDPFFSNSKEEHQMDNSGPRQFDFGVIRDATSNFSRGSELGRGGFGVVYKGALPNGVEIAVKRLSVNSGQGGKEFKTEKPRKTAGILRWRRKRLLIYELMPNLSLDRFLSDANLRSTLHWQERYKIITGISRGLQYLHEDSQLKIVHRDLKPSNILLDKEMNPKIADFGMAKLFNLDQTQANTTKVVGTIGYMAPEYVITGKFSTKSDVYSFGVIVLEIISGQLNSMSYQYSPFTSEGLLHHAWRLWQQGAIQELVDPTLGNNYLRIQVQRCIHIALLCVQEAPARRPTMSLVLTMLSSSEIELPPPTPPASFAYEINYLRHDAWPEDHASMASHGSHFSINQTC